MFVECDVDLSTILIEVSPQRIGAACSGYRTGFWSVLSSALSPLLTRGRDAVGHLHGDAGVVRSATVGVGHAVLGSAVHFGARYLPVVARAEVAILVPALLVIEEGVIHKTLLLRGGD